MKKYFTLILLLSLTFQVSYSQIKYEKESRVDRSEVPEKALIFIDSCFSQKSIKWIKETNLDSFSFEAKIKYLKQKFSIEFDTIGNIQDVELNIKFDTISENIKKNLIQNIEKEFSKYKIIKAQIQWIGENKAIRELIKTKTTKLFYSVNYEIEIRGKKEKKEAYYELLFDFSGKLIKNRKIIQTNSDNLEFD